VLNSVSRLMNDVVDNDHKAAAAQFRDLLSTYYRAEDMINIGAYKEGANPRIDLALSKIEGFNAFLKQPVEEPSELDNAINRLKQLIA
jgi:flagellum-specific ATP synthase